MRYRVHWIAVAILALIVGAPFVLYAADIDPRPIGWQLAALAFGGLLFRLISEFEETPTGMRVAATILLITLALAGIAQYLAANNGSPTEWVTYALVSQRLLCIVFAIYWPRWTDTKVSPFVREKA